MRKLKNEKGQTAIEYALIAIVLLAIITTAIAGPLQEAMSSAFDRVRDEVVGFDGTGGGEGGGDPVA